MAIQNGALNIAALHDVEVPITVHVVDGDGAPPVDRLDDVRNRIAEGDRSRRLCGLGGGKAGADQQACQQDEVPNADSAHGELLHTSEGPDPAGTFNDPATATPA